MSGRQRRDEVDIRAGRVQHVMRLMARGEWYSGSSYVDLAKKWGIAITAIETIAKDASKALRYVAQSNEDELRHLIVLAVDDIRKRCVELKLETPKGNKVHAPDLRTALRALETKARLLGLIVERTENKNLDVGKLTEAEAEALFEAARARANQIAEERGKKG